MGQFHQYFNATISVAYYLLFKVLETQTRRSGRFCFAERGICYTVSSMSHTSWDIKLKTKKSRPEPHLDPNSKPLEPQQLPQGQPLPYTASETPTGPLSTRKTQMNPKNEPLDPTTFLGSSHKVPPRPKLLLRHSVAQLKQPRLLIC